MDVPSLRTDLRGFSERVPISSVIVGNIKVSPFLRLSVDVI